MNLAYVGVALDSSLTKRFGISKRPKRTGILFLSTILIWPARYLFPHRNGPYNCCLSPANAKDGFQLAGIKFNNGLLIRDRLDFVARWNTHDAALDRGFIEHQPIRNHAARRAFERTSRHLLRDVGILH